MRSVVSVSNLSFQYADFAYKSDSLRNQILNGFRNRVSADLTALSDISFTLHAGDKLGIIGPNGAGKTTLLKVLCQIVPPSSGDLKINGRVSNLIDPSFGFEPELTGWQNIHNILIFRGIKKTEISRAARVIGDETGLGDKLHVPIYSYSEGMKLRLAFCLSTFRADQILVFDELIGGGDEKFRSYAQKKLDQMLRSDRVVVISSHDESIIRKFCNKCLYLSSGKVRAFGKVDTVLDKYKGDIGV